MIMGFILKVNLSSKIVCSVSIPRSSYGVLKLIALAGHSTMHKPQDWQSPSIYAVVSAFLIFGTSKGQTLTQVRHPTQSLSSTKAPAPQFIHLCASFTAIFNGKPNSTSSKLSSLLSDGMVGMSCFCSFLIRGILDSAISGTAGFSDHFSSCSAVFLHLL